MSENQDEQLHCFISGRVQGVFFRASTRAEAQRLQLNGWVRNLPDGRVEVFVFGQAERIHSLLDWLRQGPPMAKVEDIEFIQQGNEQMEKNTGFLIR